MTFQEMCDACPENTNFAINNIPKRDFTAFCEDIRSIQENIGAKKYIPKNFICMFCPKSLSVRFDRYGNFEGWLDDSSYRTIRDRDIRGNVMGGNYEFADLSDCSPVSLDSMSVL